MVYKEESDVTSHGNKGVERPGEELVEGTSGKVWACSSPVERATVEMEDTYSAGSRVNWMADNNWNGVEIQCSGGIKKDVGDDTNASDAIDNRAVDVQDDMIIVKEEVDTDAASGCCAAMEKDIDWSIAPSMQEGDSHCSDIEDSGNLDHSEDRELRLPYNEEVDIKEESDVDIPEGNGSLACHMRVHAGEKLHKCVICSRAFSDKSNLRRHMLTHTSEWLHKCKICSKGFHQKPHLEQHMLTHTGERPHECEICSKSFALKQTMMRHMRVHYGEKSHKCAICSRAFSHQSNLRRHMLTHTGEKPYRCEICLKGFHQKQHLKVHMLTHADEKASKCGKCSKSFALKQMPKDYICIHAGEKSHKCAICSRAFSDKSSLKRHMLTHTDERPYECGICSKGFKHKCDLMRHKKLHKQVICSGVIKKDFGDAIIASDAIDNRAVDVRDDMIIVKEEVDTDAAGGCCASMEKDIDWSIAPSMQEGDSHCSDIEDSGNLGRLKGCRENSENKAQPAMARAGHCSGLGLDSAVDPLSDKVKKISRSKGSFVISQLLIAGPGGDFIPDISVIITKQFTANSSDESYGTDFFKHKEDHSEDGELQLPHNEEVDIKEERDVDIPEGDGSLAGHMRMHAGEKSHKCAICSRAFSDKSNLKRHMLLHTGEWLHKCKICSKGFHQKGHLDQHMLTHTGEKPHKCEICSKSFALKQTMMRHVRVHFGEKSHKCAICSRAFSERSSLKRHMLTHTDERPYECGMCSKTFKHARDLTTHKKLHKQVITD
ncbi:zinc finger protein 271-like [Hetaerina americana]|uniref:zinc finger protein 271-like n=1 Tax=Hetaerina americana TaxID=62018 RepID=UPI003A7F5A91